MLMTFIPRFVKLLELTLNTVPYNTVVLFNRTSEHVLLLHMLTKVVILKKHVLWEDKSGHTLFSKDSNETSEKSKLNGHIII